jgi:hypothetical protein
MVSGSASSPISGLRVKQMFVIGSDRACHITTETTDKHTIKHMNLHTKGKRNIEVCALYRFTCDMTSSTALPRLVMASNSTL